MAHSFPPSRLEAFSDGVIAVIITIMVLELKVPHQDGVAGLRTIAPVLAVYALSFTFVSIYWVNHHLMVHRIREASPRILWANLVWLFCLSLLPFSTSYVLEKHIDSFSVELYSGLMFLTALAFMLLRLTLTARQRVEGTVEHADISLQIKHWGSLVIYLVAIPLSSRHPIVVLSMIACVTAGWIIPTLGVERCDNQHEHPPNKSSAA